MSSVTEKAKDVVICTTVGAEVGSLIPVVGTAFGAGIGLLFGLFS